jgi:Ca-activated chloride channel family protein
MQSVLWARQKISQLTRDKRLASMQSNSSIAKQDEYKSQITETAIAHHLVSQYISLVAVVVTPSRPVERQLKDRKIAKWLPRALQISHLSS